PREYAYFATEAFTYHGVTYGNHNHLMSAFAGMDGIKTGFIHASGFNLAASAVRNNRRLIGVVMGGVSAHGRAAQCRVRRPALARLHDRIQRGEEGTAEPRDVAYDRASRSRRPRETLT